MRARVILFVCAALSASACGRPALLRAIDARHLASDALVQLERASGATSRAVMAQTDADSAQQAEQAREARGKVQRDLDALTPLLQSLAFAEEGAQLQEFQRNFAEYVRLDDTILGLAVENTNIKARALAYGPAFAAADAVSEALTKAVPPSSSNWRGKALAYEAIAAIRELQVLQAPHIEEPTEAAMDKLEARMASATAHATAALAEVRRAVPDAPAATAAAESGFNRFIELNTQILDLSRRNTNVRSFALVMEQKGEHMAACERGLQALTDALGARTTAASR
jgi:hypothetical protein